VNDDGIVDMFQTISNNFERKKSDAK